MIQSINCFNYSSNVNFRAKIPFNGFYDPTCVSIPSSMKESIAEKVNEGLSNIAESPVVKASINEFKANFMPEISEKVNKVISELTEKGLMIPNKISTENFMGAASECS